ncbi:MAG: hypothetical protein ACRCZJ_03755 [Erysipelotrichaceae bacterium]
MLSRKERKQILKAKDARYRKESFDFATYIQHHFHEADGLVTIELELPRKEDVFSAYSREDNPMVASSLLEEIERLVEPIPNPYTVELVLHHDILSEQEEAILKQGIQDYFDWKLADINQDLQLNRYKITGLFAFGSSVLLLYFWMQYNNINFFVTEVMSIAGTFALWEFVDFWILERRSLKFQRLAIGQLADIQVTCKKKP